MEDFLASELSAETLAALRSHLDAARNDPPAGAAAAGDAPAAPAAAAVGPRTDAPVSSIPSSNAEYKEQSYWDKRFEEEQSYEWLVTWRDVAELLARAGLRPEHRILVVGCGNSRFSAHMADAGFVDVVNTDFSPVVIERMAAQHSSTHPTLRWLTMDMLDLQFEDGSFDAVIDKAAMDALMCDEGDVWDPHEAVVSAAKRMCRGVTRVLRPAGLFLQISFAQPHFR